MTVAVALSGVGFLVVVVGSGIAWGSKLLEDWRLAYALPPEVWLTHAIPPSTSPPGART